MTRYRETSAPNVCCSIESPDSCPILMKAIRLRSDAGIHRAFHRQSRPVQHVCINHRRRDIRMPKGFLYGADIIPPSQEMCGEGMAQDVTTHRFGESHLERRLCDGPL